MDPQISGISPSPPSRDQQFSTDLFSTSGTVSSLLRPLTPVLLPDEISAFQSPSQPASPISHHGNNSTPCSAYQQSLAMPNSYNESMLTPHKTGYGTSPLGTNGFPSGKTTPSFDPEDLPEEMILWSDDEPLFPPLDTNVLNEERSGRHITKEHLAASPTAATIDPTSSLAVATFPGHHDTRPKPIVPQLAELTSSIPRSADSDEPVITRTRRADTDGSTASWMVSPIVRVEDTESSEVNLPLPIDSLSMDPINSREAGSARTRKLSSPSLRVECRPRSKSDVGIRRIERDKDGVWCGLSPEMRTGLGISDLGQEADFLPYNLKEVEQFEKIHEKNLEVEAWLRRSPVLGPVKMTCRGLTVPKKDRRSKSISDFRFEPSGVLQPGYGVTGDVFMTEDSDSDEDVSARGSSWEEGSLDAWGESPPANVEELMSKDSETDEYDPNKDPKFLPPPRHFFSAFGPGSSGANLPPTANHAIYRFNERADNFETASRMATFGSATMRGLTLEDAFMSPRLLKQLTPKRDKGKGKEKEKEKEKSPKERKGSIFETFELPFKKRTPTNQGGGPESTVGEDTISIAASLKSSWSQRRNKLSIDTAIGQATGQLAAFGAADESKSATSVGSPTPWSPFGLTSLSPQGTKRTRGKRSKSDLSNTGSTSIAKLTKPRPTTKPEIGLMALMQQVGGPPTISITSSPTAGGTLRRHTLGSTTSIPSTVTGPVADNTGVVDESDDDDDPVTVPTPIKKLDITPTLEGYAAHISELNPRLDQKLVDRIAQEQVKRYKKLQDHQAKHLASLRQGGCPNKNKCSALNPLPPSLLATPGSMVSNSGAEEQIDNTILGAQYPPGVPAPPVTHLPAEFECTICFKVKKFSKPSDWTKHVHEDVQPFTCTFPDCSEPKSFKRKADWVRHENEKHRHLEWWKCNQSDCQHVCYRKDNFVQHLVREHKFREPKVKSVKAAMKAKVGPAGVKGKKSLATAATRSVVDPRQEQADKVMAIVELCHNETKKHPSSESCRFCGSTCSTWKKLTVHLARHMENISLPILDLIKGDGVRCFVPTIGPSVPPAAAAGFAAPMASAARGEVASQFNSNQLNVDEDHFYTHHQVGVPTQPLGQTSNLFFPTSPTGEIGSQHNLHMPALPSSMPTTSMPMLSSSPPMNITLTYLDPNSFQDQSYMEGQQEGGAGGSEAEFYPTPSGSVSPYLIPSQHSIYSTTYSTGGGLLNASDAQYFTVPTPGTTPPRSRHGLPNSQPQYQLGGASTNLDLLTHTHSPVVTSTINMAMLNTSLPTTSISMEQLTLTSGPTSSNVTDISMGVGMGMTMEMGSLEQSRIQDLERLYHSNANANANPVEGSNAPPDLCDSWYPPEVELFQSFR